MKVKIDIGPYKPESKKIISYTREAPDSFTVRLDWQLDHKPGQFAFCSVPGIGESAISICSDSKEYVEMNIREVGNVTNALGKLKVGEDMLVRGPYGSHYPMEDLKGNDFLIIGGGCGVAPLRGVIKYIDNHRSDFNDVTLMFGFRDPENALFKDDHEQWNNDHKLLVKFDAIEHDNPTNLCFSGTQGFVTELVKKNIDNNHNFVICILNSSIWLSIGK